MSNYNDIETMMEALIERTKIIVNEAYMHHREFHAKTPLMEGKPSTLLVFPRFFHGKEDETTGWTRISEQELRFAFVQAFHEYVCEHKCKYYYSVEPPTVDSYTFSKVENNKRKKIDPIIGKGQSGNFDMAIYDENLKRVCLIEFKSGYVTPQAINEVKAKLTNKKELGEKTKCYLIYMVKENANDIQVVNNIQTKKIILNVTTNI
jgi:hypothetical protein